jgi:hypothetical protein
MTRTSVHTGEVSWDRALAWRMRQQHLSERAKPADIVRVVSDICGLHAQVRSSAVLSLWARIDDLTYDALDTSLWQDRQLVKLWAARGTLHVLPAAEIGVWLAALGTQTKFGNVGHPDIDRIADAAGQALRDRLLTRDELAQEVARLTGSPSLGELVRSNWGSYLKATSFRGQICFAPGDGPLVRFTNPATWLPDSIAGPEPASALQDITRRFLHAYAPATAADLTRWWLGPPRPRRGTSLLNALGDEAVEIPVEGEHAWALTRDVPGMAAAEPHDVVRLLPAFDPWVVGVARHAPMIEPQHQSRVYRPQGWISPVVLMNGRIAGTWKHERTRHRARVEIEPFRSMPRWARLQAEAEAERLAAFFGCPLALSWG